MKKYLLLILPFLLFASNAQAAIVGSTLTTGITVAGNSTGSTASYTPGANDLILLTVTARTNISALTNQPTVTGNGLTWVLVLDAAYDTGAPSEKRVSVFRAMGASPTTGVTTIDYGGQAQTDIDWTVAQFTGTDTSGSNGSGAIVQTSSTIDQSGTTSTIAVSLNALGSANNAMFVGGAGDGAGNQFNPPINGFTSLGTVSSTNLTGVTAQYKINATTSSITASGATSMLGIIGVEVKAAGAVASTARRRQTMIVN